MAQRKSAPTGKSTSGKPSSAASPAAKQAASKPADPAAAKRPAGGGAKGVAGAGAGSKRPAGATGAKRPAGGATSAARKPPPGRGSGGRPPNRKPGKSIVNQKQTPWGLIIATMAVVAFAAAIVVVVIVTRKSSNSPSALNKSNCSTMIGKDSTSYLNELKCASQIKGITFKQEPNRTHVQTRVTYDATPPVGGNHSAYWADCNGTVYPKAIANENAVHMLEHGAIWITYNAKTLPSSGVGQLAKYVSGQDRMAMSPYPNLKTPISLQAWGYQLFLTSASDPRIAQFISDLRYNEKTTPEYGASCTQSTFKAHPSTFGNPLWQPAGA
jgi:uncharacterized protein DUF3105